MCPMFLFDTGTAASQVFDAGLFGADHVEYLSIMVALLVAFDIVYFLLYVHLNGFGFFYNYLKI
jgi:hypothetical protein